MTQQNFREEAIAELVAQKQQEYALRESDRYFSSLSLGRDEIRKKYSEMKTPFTATEKKSIEKFISLFKANQAISSEITTVERAINRHNSDIGQLSSSIEFLTNADDKITSAYRESLPEFAQIEFLEIPTYNYNNEKFVFYSSKLGTDDYVAKKVLEYENIQKNDKQRDELKSKLVELQADLTVAQKRKEDLLSTLSKNSAELRELAKQLPAIYEKFVAQQAKLKSAMEKELKDFGDKLYAEFYGETTSSKTSSAR